MAKRYEFRLETLLRLRRQCEDEQKRVVAARLREIRSLQERRTFLETEIANQSTALRESLTSDWIEVDQLKLGRHWMVRLRRGVLEADAEITAHHAMLAQERSSLAQARKNAKILDKLKEKQREAYLAEVNRREQVDLDEMNVSRFALAAVAKDDLEP